MVASVPARARAGGESRFAALRVSRRAVPSLVAGGVLTALLIRMAWQSGGYFPSSYTATGAIALAATGVLLLVVRPRFGLSTEALVALAGLTGLTAWTGLSAAWSDAPAGAVDAMQRDLAYVGLFSLAIVAAGTGRYASRLVWLALGIIAVVCGAALIARLVPSAITETDVGAGQFRLAYPLSYWNALGAMAATGAVLAFGLSADPRTRPASRAAAGSLAVVLLTTMALSLSRGSYLALFAGLGALFALSANRGSLLTAAAIIGPAGALAVWRVNSYAALTDDPRAEAGQAAAGEAFAPQLLLLCAIVAAALAVVARARSSSAMRQLGRTVRPAAYALAGLAVAVVLVGYGLKAASVEGRSAGVLGDAETWVSEQWDDFMAPAAEASGEQGRARVLTGASGSRADVYRVALDGFGESPLIGIGAGSYAVRWTAERPVAEQARNAHSLEVETLAELGLVGVLLLGAFLGAIVFATVRARVRPGALPRSQVAAIGGAVAVWLVHSAVDWDWQVSAYTGVVLVLAASVLPYGRRRAPAGDSAMIRATWTSDSARSARRGS